MKILFIIRSINYFHYYRSIVEALCKRGCTVELLFDEGWSSGANLEPLHKALSEYPTLSWDWSVRRRGVWKQILFVARELRSYRRYLTVTGQSTFYRDRWLHYLPRFIRIIIKYVPGMRALVGTAAVESLLAAMEKVTGPTPAVVRDVRTRAPHVIVVTPLNQRYAEELEYVKAARVLGIPSAGSVLSWDNLTSKGLIHVRPDVLLVWNETQKSEAYDHHQIPQERTRIIGAPVFDQWFSEVPHLISREDFCKAHGIDPTRPYLLYLGTSRNLAHNEGWVVEKLRDILDTSPELKDTQIVVRPHGSNYVTYRDINRKDVVVVPKEGTLPSTLEAYTLSYSSMYYAVGITGINTSAMLEAMIVGKPVAALLLPEYRQTQEETQHFKQLLTAKAIIPAKTDEEIRATVKDFVEGIDRTHEAREGFIEHFIRPYGRNISAGEKAAEYIVGLASHHA